MMGPTTRDSSNRLLTLLATILALQTCMTGQYYRHFKGNIYKVLHIAKHSETLEDMVVYQAMYGERSIWVRPKEMFDESIERDGKVIRRFSPISAEEAEKIINKL